MSLSKSTIILDTKYSSPTPSPTRGEGTFPPLMGNVIELRQNVSPFQGSNTIELYTQGCPPWAILCQPFGLYHMQKNFYPLIQRHCVRKEGIKGRSSTVFVITCSYWTD